MATTKTATIERKAYSYDEFAKMLGKHRTWVYRQVTAGKIKPITGYGAAMISAAELDRILGEGGAK